MNTSRQNNEKRKRTRRPRQGQRNAHPMPRGNNDSLLVIPRSVGAIVPDRLRTNLRVFQASAKNLSVVSYGIERFAPTAAQALAPEAPAGFAELANLYRSYRVRGSRITVEANNTSPNSQVQLTVHPTNHDPGSTPSGDYVVAARDNAYAVSKCCAPVGGNSTKVMSAMSTRKLYGSAMVEYDDNFSSLVTTTPLNNWWWIISFYSLSTIPSTEPLLINTLIEIEIDFFDRAFVIQH